MKAYKFFRGLLKASALTTVMFIMQACYGTPNKPPKLPDETEQTNEEVMEMQTPVSDTLVQVE